VEQAQPPGDPPEFIPERIGVTSEGVVLSGGSETVGFVLTQPNAVRSRAGRTEPARVLLNVEHIRSRSVPKTSYGVYIDPADGTSNDEYFVGSIPFFGLRESSQDDAEHELRYTFDVTEIVNALRDQDKWDANRVQITFRPLNQPALEAAEGFGAEVEIGSVSIAYQ
jgi:tyrosinase